MKLLDQLKAWWRGSQSPPILYPDAPSWEFGRVWNQSLTARKEREPRARNNVWASEIGGAMIDRYLRMTGVPQSNIPNDRSLRKFQAADVWEWIVGFVLIRAGILISCQEKLRFQYPGLLETVGKLDHLAGGQPNWNKARREVKAIGLPEIIETASLAIIDQLSATYGDDPIRTIVLEVKSVGSFVFERYETAKEADARHQGQIFHYLKAKGLPEGHIAYVSRDDCRIAEFPVLNPSKAEIPYKRDLEEITHYIVNRERPRIESEVLFDDVKFRFSTNWKVEYSNYLTLLYGYKQPIEYRERWDKSISSFNRTFKRCVTEARMTDLNLKTIETAKKTFPVWDDLVDRAKVAAAANPDIVKDEEEAEAA